MLLLLSFGFLIVLAVLLLSIWSTVRAYNVKHTIDPPEDASKGLTDKKILNDDASVPYGRRNHRQLQHPRHALLQSAYYAAVLPLRGIERYTHPLHQIQSAGDTPLFPPWPCLFCCCLFSFFPYFKHDFIRIRDTLAAVKNLRLVFRFFMRRCRFRSCKLDLKRFRLLIRGGFVRIAPAGR